MSSSRPDLHVAQQIRRDKLRIQNSSQHLQEFPNNLEQLSLHPGFNLDLLHVRNVRNANVLDEPALYPSEMISFSTASNPLSAPRNTLECQELGAGEPSRLVMSQYGSFPHSSSGVQSSPKEQCEPRNLGNWRNSGSHQGCDWMPNYASCSVANEGNPNSFLAAELNNLSTHQHYGKPSCNVLTDVQSSPSNRSGEMASREIQRQLGEMHYPSSSPPLYQNALQDIFKSGSISAHGSEMASLMQQTGHGILGGNASELVLHPSYGNQANQLRFGSANLWTTRTVDNTLRWNSPLDFTDKKINEDSGPVLSDSNPQGLSLSLSSNTQSKRSGSSMFEEGSASDDLQSRCGISKDPQYSKDVKSLMKPSIISRDCGKSLQDMMGNPSNATYRNVGPLGPFTGYATILKSSIFLKPCQQLLDECCCLSGPKFAKACDVSERVSREVSASTSADAVNVNESGVAAKGSNSGASSSMLYRSKENSADGGAASSFCLSSRPECQKNKAQLLYMHEEVNRRYKQYHQQMQMVVSSFESVAGLSSATPYISLALKSLSRHFRCLKTAISDQLKLISEVLGEDLSIPTTSTSSKFDTNMARLRCMDQSFQKNKSGGVNMDFLEPQQHVWRPQRGLPERSVAILKAWLFEHFLHPYPTDTDKHMLATQTGLSRNQVSNWFINARVRVWKPMVEEIHMLETKGTTGANQNSSINEGISASEGTSQPRVDQPPSKFGTHAIREKQFHCLEMGSSLAGNEENGLDAEQWNQEKRSKLECQITSSMDGTLMGFMPFRRGGLEVGGLGSVSLTLGLRHGVEGVQYQQQQLQQEEQLRRHFGGHMIHDFVG